MPCLSSDMTSFFSQNHYTEGVCREKSNFTQNNTKHFPFFILCEFLLQSNMLQNTGLYLNVFLEHDILQRRERKSKAEPETSKKKTCLIYRNNITFECNINSAR